MAETMTKHRANVEAIVADLTLFTRRWGELGEPCWLELRTFGEHLTPQNSKWRVEPDELLEAAHWAAVMNALQRNVYAVRNPIRDACGPSAKDADILAAFYLWADCDDDASAGNIRTFTDAKVSAVVRTGSVPGERVHTYWELAEPIRDLAAWRRVQEAIAARFQSDESVVNASRIMRVAGTVCWPDSRKQARGYVPETARMILPQTPRDPMPFERAARIWPAAQPDLSRPPVSGLAAQAMAAATPRPSAQGVQFGTAEAPASLDRQEAQARAAAGDRWHDHVVRLVGSYVAKGLSDEEIHALTDPLTLPGWTVDQTRREVAQAIDGARRKGWAPPLVESAPPQTQPRGEGEESPFRPFQASALAGLEVPPRDWHVPELIPGRTVTMLGGDGGVGKSLLALQLAVSTALGTPWIGCECRPGPALFITAEDERDEVHRRLSDTVTAAGRSLHDLKDLHVASLAGEDALLAVLDRRSETIAATTLFAEIEAYADRISPAVIVLDTLADLFGGDENRRGQARQFIGLLRGLAMRVGCAVVLLAHPSLSGMQSGSGTSGSTAWNGSVRSRLYLERVADEGFEPDPDARRLTTKKANYGRAGTEFALRWDAGAFVRSDQPSGDRLDKMAASAKAERVFLKLLRELTAQGRTVNHAGGPNYAPKVFAENPRAEGCTKPALRAAMENLLAGGKLRVEPHGPPSRGLSKLVEGGPK